MAAKKYLVSMLLTLTLISVVPVRSSNLSDKGTKKRVLTFNAALGDIGNGVIGAAHRGDALLEELLNLDADVICLQEIFAGSDVLKFVNGLSAAGYQGTLSYLHDNATWTLPDLENPTSPPCDVSLFAFATQIQSKCAEAFALGRDEIISCILENFGLEFGSLPADCLTCIGTNGGFLNAVQTCSLTPGYVNAPGLLLFSKGQMTSQEVVNFHSNKTFLSRFYLKANIDDIGPTVCTHLTADTEGEYMERFLSYESYEEQNLVQAEAILSAIENDKQVLLLGDFNFGPELPYYNITGVFEDSYTQFEKSTLKVKLSATCTFCPYNPWNVIQENPDNVVIDHVFVKTHYSLCAERVLDKNDRVFLSETSQYYPISDHYGVLATIRVISPRPL